MEKENRYQMALDKARAFEQVDAALKQGSVKSPHSVSPHEEGYERAIRAKVSIGVYAIWNETHKPAQLYNIFVKVLRSIEADIQLGDKSWIGKVPGKRTVDRRVNQCADKKFYPNTVTPIICVKAGYYIPNPACFEGIARTMLEALLNP